MGNTIPLLGQAMDATAVPHIVEVPNLDGGSVYNIVDEVQDDTTRNDHFGTHALIAATDPMFGKVTLWDYNQTQVVPQLTDSTVASTRRLVRRLPFFLGSHFTGNRISKNVSVHGLGTERREGGREHGSAQGRGTQVVNTWGGARGAVREAMDAVVGRCRSLFFRSGCGLNREGWSTTRLVRA